MGLLSMMGRESLVQLVYGGELTVTAKDRYAHFVRND